MATLLKTALLFGSIWAVNGVNFPYEAVQLSDADTQSFPAIAFGNASSVPAAYSGPRCKVGPGDQGWPSDQEWAAFNASIAGKLVKPNPPFGVCFSGPNYNKDRCDFVSGPAAATRFFLNDPVSSMTSWTTGDTCSPTTNPKFNCTQGGFPVYVVNATTVKDVQTAVNYARNKNLRLVIRNTGHDFVGRSSGYGALSIWVHYLKNVEYLGETTVGQYKGLAAKLSAGTEAFEADNAMAAHNFTLVVTGAPTVSVVGGWAQGGGHSSLSSLYGLGSDQLLSLNVVTADGRFITADATHNQELFFALRGGGPGTFGIVTSAIVKAYPGGLNLVGSTYAITTGPSDPGTFTSLSPIKPSKTAIVVKDLETFWRAFNVYLSFAPNITAVGIGGIGFGDFTVVNNDSVLFVGSFLVPNKTPAEAAAFLAPVYAALRDLGIDLNEPPISTVIYAMPAYKGSEDAGPNNKVFSSRLFPRANWANATLFGLTVNAIRRTVELGHLNYRCRNFAPSLAAGGYLANVSGVNPAFRESLMHSTVFEQQLADRDTTTPDDWRARYDNLKKYMDGLRAVTPGSGAYINEAEVTEPNWQQSFFGNLYPRLLATKKAVDPWDLFWAPTTVGSENWAVVSVDGLPTQNGPLCRVATK